MKKIRLFMPTYYRPKMVRECVVSCQETMKSEGYDVFLNIVDNNSGSELRKWLAGRKSENTCVDLLSENIGKAKAINFLTEKYNDFDYFINIDSDIMTFDEGWPGILAEVFDEIPRAGMVSPNYTNNGNNPMPDQPEEMNVSVGDQEYTFCFGSGVAGGCFLTSRGVWDDLGGYHAKGKYGGVDGRARKTIAESLGRKCGFLRELKVEHMIDPPEYEDYVKWKLEVQNNFWKYGFDADPEKIGNDKGFYDEE